MLDTFILTERCKVTAQQIKKGFLPNSEWNDTEEFVESYYWIKELFAVLSGILFSCLGFTGIFAIISFIVINYLFQLIYVKDYHLVSRKLDESPQNIIGSTWFSNFATFLMTWVLSYSILKN
uniref:Uncharacterized protein RAB5IF homolog (Trinotate prediction) n=1 Tax=Myxobolus squamalis TaxID=59785 RepID=A0A6B2GBE2_MYXSQ